MLGRPRGRRRPGRRPRRSSPGPPASPTCRRGASTACWSGCAGSCPTAPSSPSGAAGGRLAGRAPSRNAPETCGSLPAEPPLPTVREHAPYRPPGGPHDHHPRGRPAAPAPARPPAAGRRPAARPSDFLGRAAEVGVEVAGPLASGGLVVDLPATPCTLDGDELDLSPRQVELLALFLAGPAQGVEPRAAALGLLGRHQPVAAGRRAAVPAAGQDRPRPVPQRPRPRLGAAPGRLTARPGGGRAAGGPPPRGDGSRRSRRC